MGIDLVSACIFCAGMLMPAGLPPPSGYSAELSASYATLQRQLLSGSELSDDRSDVTIKSVLAGARWVRTPERDLGAGTPASEWSLGFVFPTSHDETSSSPSSPIQVVATGGGRYENFAGVFRYEVDPSDSLELGIQHRRHKITDLVNFGGTQFTFAEERDAIAERDDLVIGWRHRWKGLEVAGQWNGSILEGTVASARSVLRATGNPMGARAEVRGSRGSWTASLQAQGLWGNIPTSIDLLEGSGPQHFRAPVSLEALGLTVMREGKGLDVSLSATRDQSRLPFVALAILGSESLAFDSGSRPTSDTRQWFFDLALQGKVNGVFFPRFFFRYAHGSETVKLNESAGRPAETLHILRGGQFPPSGTRPSAPEYTVGVALDFAIGRSQPAGHPVGN